MTLQTRDDLERLLVLLGYCSQDDLQAALRDRHFDQLPDDVFVCDACCDGRLAVQAIEGRPNATGEALWALVCLDCDYYRNA